MTRALLLLLAFVLLNLGGACSDEDEDLVHYIPDLKEETLDSVIRENVLAGRERRQTGGNGGGAFPDISFR